MGPDINLYSLEAMFNNSMNDIVELISTYVPTLLMSLAILIIGWLVALIISALIGGVIKKTPLDKMLAESLGEKHNKHKSVGDRIKTLSFYLIMLFVLVAFFQSLGLTLVTEPLNEMLNQIFAFAPRLIAGGALLLVAWLIATIVKNVLSKILLAANLDEKLASKTGKKSEKISLSSSVTETVYWLIFLLIIPTVLNALGLVSILEPVNDMFSELLGYLPNIFSSVIILAVGWFFARVIQRVTTSLLESVNIDGFTSSIGLSNLLGKTELSNVIGLVVYVLVLFPVLIAALDALKLEAIVAPATSMLHSILEAIPYIFAALLVIAIAYMVGRFTATLVENLLSSIGFDHVLSWIGLNTKEPSSVNEKPSHIAGNIVLVAILLFASMEAFDLLGFNNISQLISQFIIFAGQILLGLIILAVGLMVSNIAVKAIQSTGSSHSGLLATIARAAVIVLATAMGLRQMGLANEIINLAFGILFGAVAVAIALAFGLGCKDIAAKEVEKVLKSMK